MRDDKKASQTLGENEGTAVDEPAKRPAPAGPKKPIEEWATAKKMLPQFFEPAARVMPTAFLNLPSVGVSMAAIPAPKYNTEHAKYVAAKQLRNWPIGFEVTEAEFDQAVDEAMKVQ